MCTWRDSGDVEVSIRDLLSGLVVHGRCPSAVTGESLLPVTSADSSSAATGSLNGSTSRLGVNGPLARLPNRVYDPCPRRPFVLRPHDMSILRAISYCNAAVVGALHAFMQCGSSVTICRFAAARRPRFFVSI